VKKIGFQFHKISKKFALFSQFENNKAKMFYIKAG